MSLVQFLFSFDGRVRRRDFWIFFIVLTLFYGSVLWAVGEHGHHDVDGDFGAFYGLHVVRHNLAATLFGVAAVWAKLAVTVKRWHDRDKSGWWVLINLIPVIGWIWQIVEGGFLDGTGGPNRFGRSPKAVDGAVNRLA